MSIFQVNSCPVLKRFWERLSKDFKKSLKVGVENMSKEFALSIQDQQLLMEFKQKASVLRLKESHFGNFYAALQDGNFSQDSAVWNYRLAASKVTSALTEGLVNWQLLRLRSMSEAEKWEAHWLARFSAYLRFCNLERKVAFFTTLHSIVQEFPTSSYPDIWVQECLDM
jgi:hypothetical protein